MQTNLSNGNVNHILILNTNPTMFLSQTDGNAAVLRCRGIRTSKQQCTQCQCVLPTPYLLSLHVSEQHDSFFATQAAHRMPVFQCLVEGCATTFTSVGQRHQHLTDLHQIASDSGFDRYAEGSVICVCFNKLSAE